MKARTCPDARALAQVVAAEAAEILRATLARKKTARILVGSDLWLQASLAQLAREPSVRWSDVDLFQFEEWVGLGAEHPASSRKFLCDHLVVPARVGRYHLLDAAENADRACRSAGAALAAAPIDLALVGVGETGTVAHHAGPADFFSETPYLKVRLDAVGRRQLGEQPGFESGAAVPDSVIVASLRQLLKAEHVFGVLSPRAHPGLASRLEAGPASPLVPASILRTHEDVRLFSLSDPG